MPVREVKSIGADRMFLYPHLSLFGVIVWAQTSLAGEVVTRGEGEPFQRKEKRKRKTFPSTYARALGGGEG